MENLEQARKIIEHFVGLLVIENSICVSMHDIGQCANQILFELLKDVYITEPQERESLYRISGATVDNDLKMHSRTMQYSNYYREQSAQQFKADYDFIPPELVVPDINDHYNRSAGYQLSSYEKEQMKAIENPKLFKSITNRRIADVKKLDNTELMIEFEEYLDYFKDKSSWLHYDDDDFILYSMLLFTTELKYRVITICHMADRLSMF